MTKGGISTLVRRFFDANFEVNRRRRKTNLVLRENRAVLTCIVGHPNVGKKTLIQRLIGPNPKEVEGSIPDKGRPDLVDHSLTWYKVEGGVYLMNEPGVVPPVTDNPLACTRLAVCGNYENATVSETLVAEHLISHLGSLRGKDPIMGRIQRDVSVHPGSLPAPDFLREYLPLATSPISMYRVAEVKFDGDVTSAARHLLEAYRRLEYGTFALEMPYMLHGGFELEEPLVYDKDTATGLQSGIMSQF